MALLSEAVKEKKFDIRMIKRSTSSGLVTQDEMNKNSLTLKDDSENADYTNIDTLFESITSKKNTKSS